MPSRSEVGVDGGEEAFAEVVGFEQTPEFQERGGVGHAVCGEVNAGKALERLAVVEGVFEGFVGQAIPLLEEIDPPHPLQSDGRATAFAFRIEGFDDGQQSHPRDEGFHAREELFTAGGPLFGGKLGLGETRLVRQTSSLGNRAQLVCQINQNRRTKSTLP